MTRDEYIRKHYGKVKTKDIALALGVSDTTIRCRAKRLGLAQKQRVMTKPCEGCQLWSGTHCIYGNEGEVARCKAMRYTKGEWPKKKTTLQELFELI